MEAEYTFAMIKPLAFEQNLTGPVLSRIAGAGFRISALKTVKLSYAQASQFYAVHQGKFFFENLVTYISSGPVAAIVLEKENAVSDFRKLIGSTDPGKASKETIRHMFGKSKLQNAIHGSDSIESAKRECAYFFSNMERF